MERLQKMLAKCGVASRRKAEELIKDGRVSVNGEVISQLGTKVSRKDTILVDGKEVSMLETKYYVINKPRYILSSVSDDKGRKTIINILPAEMQSEKLFPVGRLDYDTKGVLLLTNDGEFMNSLVGPTSHTEKEYLVRVDGIFTKADIKKLQNGVNIGGYVTRNCKAFVKEIDNKAKSSLLSITIQEGKYHQVKLMCEALGYKVKRLTRIRFGCIELSNLPEGSFRELTPHEIKQLLADSKVEKVYKEPRYRYI